MKPAYFTYHTDIIKGETEMNDYVANPFEEEAHITAIDRWSGQGPESFTTPKSSTMGKKQITPLYELKKLENIARDNQQFILKMITLFTRQAPADVNEIETAFTQQDYSTIRAVAHRMKPSLDSMGIQSLYSLIREVEKFNENETTTHELENKIRELRGTIGQVVDQLKKEVMNPDPPKR